MQPNATRYGMVCRCVSVCVYVTRMNPAKTAELIEMLVGMWGRMDPSNHVLDGGPDPPRGRGNFWGWAYMGMPAVIIFNKMMQPFIELLRSLVYICSFKNLHRCMW